MCNAHADFFPALAARTLFFDLLIPHVMHSNTSARTSAVSLMNDLTPVAKPLEEHLLDVAAPVSLSDERHQDVHQSSVTQSRPYTSDSLPVHVHQPLREAHGHPGFVSIVGFDRHKTSDSDASHLNQLLPPRLGDRRNSAPEAYSFTLDVGAATFSHHSLASYPPARHDFHFPFIPVSQPSSGDLNESTLFSGSYHSPPHPSSVDHSPGANSLSRSASLPSVSYYPTSSRGYSHPEHGYSYTDVHHQPRLDAPTPFPVGPDSAFIHSANSRKRLSSDVDQHQEMFEYSGHPAPAVSSSGGPSFPSDSRPLSLSPRSLYQVDEDFNSPQYQAFSSAIYARDHHAHARAHSRDQLQQLMVARSNSSASNCSYEHSGDDSSSVATSVDDSARGSDKRRRLSVGSLSGSPPGSAGRGRESVTRDRYSNIENLYRSPEPRSREHCDFGGGPAYLASSASLAQLLGTPRTPGPQSLPLSPFVEPSSPTSARSSDGGLAPDVDTRYPSNSDVAIIHRAPPDADFECEESLRPRLQKTRFEEDHYTPLWVRKTGHAREGFCSLCPGDGKWLQYVFRSSDYLHLPS